MTIYSPHFLFLLLDTYGTSLTLINSFLSLLGLSPLATTDYKFFTYSPLAMNFCILSLSLRPMARMVWVGTTA